jgi:hypothetical protein
MQTLFNAPQVEEIGEDTWDLFKSIEKSFDVDLGDYRDLAGITVLALSQRIGSLAEYPIENSCLSQVAFNKLREGFMTITGTKRSLIRPSTRIEHLLPLATRHLKWDALQLELGLQLPVLSLSLWLLASCLIVPLALLIGSRMLFGSRVSFDFIILGSLAATSIAFRAARSYPAKTIPANLQTVGDLAKAVIACNYKALARAHGSSHERGVLPALRLLIAMETGINIKAISPETRIPSGLNIY